MNRSFRVAVAASGIFAAACVQKPAATTSTPVAQPQVTMASDTGMRDDEHRGMMGGMNAERMDAMVFNGITLTASQRAQVDSIHARHRAEMQGLDPRNNAGDREKMRQMMQAHMVEIRAVLSPDQQVVFDRNVQQMREHRGERMGAPPRE